MSFLPDANSTENQNRSPRPDFIPPKFWDEQTGTVRLEQLAKSYAELERRMGGMVRMPAQDAAPEDIQSFHRALGVPENPDGYQITAAHPMVAPRADVNARLHAAGFTPNQVQLVYDLAAETLLPMADNLEAETVAQRESERLHAHFGGKESFARIGPQIAAWGERNLPKDVFQALASSSEGVIAMAKLMQSGESEPELVGNAEGFGSELALEDLKKMMRDPRYWKTRDPAYIAKVTQGFERLYPGNE